MQTQYRYALDDRGQLIDVWGLERSEVDFGRVFTCVGCGGEIFAKLGDLKAKHFSHKSLGDSCRHETYLHRLSKAVFFAAYQQCLEDGVPFYLTWRENVLCDHFEKDYGYTCVRIEERCYDLTQYFDRIALEEPFAGFVPDVLLRSSTSESVLFVEFAVSHKCEEEKLSTGLPIIEITVRDEAHLEPAKAHRLSDSDERVTIHNLRARNRKKSLCGGQCPEKMNVFVVYESKRSILLELSPQPDLKKQIKGKIQHLEVLGKSTGIKEHQMSLYRQQVRRAHFKGVPISNCFLCRYHGGAGGDNAVFCKVARQNVGSNQAAECETYRPFSSLDECVEQDKKNERFVHKRQLRQFSRTSLPRAASK